MRKLAAVTPDETQQEPPLSEQAYRLLRNKILLGEIAPGAKLKTEDLQREHGFSNSPLREALNRLAAAGLATADERRGFRASAISLADFQDLTTYRLAIEHAALVDSMAKATDEWEASVLAAFHRLEAAETQKAAQGGLNPSWTERHKAFHMALLGACSSRRLLAQCSEMFDHAERYRRLSALHREPGPRRARDEHQKLVDLALARNVDAAAALLRQHVLRTADNCAKILGAMSQS